MTASLLPAWEGGELLESGAACGDRGGVLLETLGRRNGRPTFLGRHLARLAQGASELGLPLDREAAAQALLAVARTAPPGPLAMGLRLDLHGGLTVRCRRPHMPGVLGARALLSSGLRAPWSERSHLKLAERGLLDRARELALEGACWDALLTGPGGELVEGCASNLFAVMPGALLTPPLESGCLPGVGRAVLLEDLERSPLANLVLRETRLAPELVPEAEELLLVNSVVGVVPLLGLEGVAEDLPGTRGGVYQDLDRRFGCLEARSLAEVDG